MKFYKLLCVGLCLPVLVSCQSDNNKDMEILMHNVVVLQASVDKLHELVAANNAHNPNQNTNRLPSNLVNEFADDDQFLNTVVELKKQKLLAELQYDIDRLDDTPVTTVANNGASNVRPVAVAIEPMDVFAINYSAGSALVKVGDRLQSVYQGDEIGAYTVKKINSDSLLVSLPNGETKTKRLLRNADTSDTKINAPKDNEAPSSIELDL